MTGIRTDTVPACSEMPAPVEEVELAELLKVSVGTVVVLEVEFPIGVSVLLAVWETTC